MHVYEGFEYPDLAVAFHCREEAAAAKPSQPPQARYKKISQYF
jgi:hypothetical protein